VARLTWTQAALRDVARLHGFLAPKNRDAARRAVRAIRQGVKLLSAHPEIGRPVEAMPAGFREWLIRFGDGGYVVLYRYEGKVVSILAVRHEREVGYQLTQDSPC
jgi:plasmid stabilization system protein ParE